MKQAHQMKNVVGMRIHHMKEHIKTNHKHQNIYSRYMIRMKMHIAAIIYVVCNNVISFSFLSSAEWEFNYPIHDWLNKVIREQKTMTSEINSNIASKPLLWRIIDLSYSEVAPSTLSQSDQEGIRTLISSALQIGQTNECTVLAPSAERCLRSLAKINILEFTRNACFSLSSLF
ncbi:unnamed protein product [Rhizophagus irregularis]|nr:unnamed protein product [Rhizophagus irregularis]